ncbi:MAG: hypothetical protein JO279_14855 [Verrucomicrobia bacterium]|nr:hypothetical protein [Verrucomicrobiota bacterium]
MSSTAHNTASRHRRVIESLIALAPGYRSPRETQMLVRPSSLVIEIPVPDFAMDGRGRGSRFPDGKQETEGDGHQRSQETHKL